MLPFFLIDGQGGEFAQLRFHFSFNRSQVEFLGLGAIRPKAFVVAVFSEI